MLVFLQTRVLLTVFVDLMPVNLYAKLQTDTKCTVSVFLLVEPRAESEVQVAREAETKLRLRDIYKQIEASS